MVTWKDQDFYNTYRLLGCRHSGFREIFPNHSPEEIKQLERNYRENEKELKISFKAWWKTWKCEPVRDVSPCCG